MERQLQKLALATCTGLNSEGRAIFFEEGLWRNRFVIWLGQAIAKLKNA
jgi:hypothetical protein